MKSRVWLDYWSDIEGECQAQRDGKKATRQSSIAEISSAERFCAGRGYGDTFMEMFQGKKTGGLGLRGSGRDQAEENTVVSARSCRAVFPLYVER